MKFILVAFLTITLTHSKHIKAEEANKTRTPASVNDSEALEFMKLDCVYDGIKEATSGTPLEDLNPSRRWLAFLGAGAQHFYMVTPKYSSTLAMPTKLRKEYEAAGVENPQEQYLIKVIQMVQAYGFCSDKKLTANAEITEQVGFGDLTNKTKKLRTGFLASREINEKALLNQLSSGNAREDKRQNYNEMIRDLSLSMGFKSEEGLKDLFRPDIFVSASVTERREIFNNFATRSWQSSGGESPTSPTLDTQTDDGLKMRHCIEDIQTLQKKSSFFQVTGPKAGNNKKLCKAMANACEVPEDSCNGASFTSKPSKPGSGANAPRKSVGDMDDVKTGTK